MNGRVQKSARKIVATTAIFLVIGTLLTSWAQESKAITNNDIVEMVRAGLAEDTIILAIAKGMKKFDTSPTALITLKHQGVSQRVLDAMLKSQGGEATTATISGIYLRKQTNSIVDLHLDGTFSAHESGQNMTGTFTVSNSILTLIVGGSAVMNLKIDSDSLTDRIGNVWMKQNDGGGAPGGAITRATQPDKYYVLSGERQLLELSAVATKMQSKGKGALSMMVGVYGGKVFFEIPGERASVRLKATDAQVFVVGSAFPLPEPLPEGLYAMLIRLEVVKPGKRQWIEISSSGNLINRGNVQVADSRGVPLNAALYDTYSIRLEPRAPLAPGEYAFYLPSKDPYNQGEFLFYCFGID